MRVLFAASEVFPLAQCSGLADVAGALPVALAELGVDVRVLTPAYLGSLEKLYSKRRLAAFDVRGQMFVLWEGHLPNSGVTLWLLDFPPLYAREGDPYHNASGDPHHDNPWRFGCFCEAITRLSVGAAGLSWQPDVVHLNDWQTGLASAWLSRESPRPRTLFAIHNIAQQGIYGRDQFNELWLPQEWWAPEALEFHHGWSFMKGGLVFSDVITTVSPSYVREIQTPDSGHGLHGLLRYRAGALHGILNGIDERVWNPARDTLIAQTYSAATVTTGKRPNKLALQSEFGLRQDEYVPLIGMIGRLAHQKGSDLVLEAQQELLKLGMQLAVLGSGERGLECGFSEWARMNPQRVGVKLAYDERSAHLLVAGADMLLVPSRFEACGSSPMYGQRYGTIPVVCGIGGLADAVVDATPEALEAGTATGIRFEHADAACMLAGVQRALALYDNVRVWDDLQRVGMTRDYSWRRAAREYLNLYAGSGHSPPRVP